MTRIENIVYLGPLMARLVLNAAAGAGLGAFVSLLIALSSSPVVASAVSVVLAAGMVFLSLEKKAKPKPANEQHLVPDTSDALWRIVGFCLAGICALLAGVYLRAHNSLGESSASAIYSELTGIGVSPEDAKKVVVLRLSGRPTNEKEGGGKSNVEDRFRQTTLFASEASAAQCREMNPNRFENYQDAKDKYIHEGPPWTEIVGAAETAAKSSVKLDSLSVLTGAYLAVCTRSGG
jgi:hypothetical protein